MRTKFRRRRGRDQQGDFAAGRALFEGRAAISESLPRRNSSWSLVTSRARQAGGRREFRGRRPSDGFSDAMRSFVKD